MRVCRAMRDEKSWEKGLGDGEVEMQERQQLGLKDKGGNDVVVNGMPSRGTKGGNGGVLKWQSRPGEYTREGPMKRGTQEIAVEVERERTVCGDGPQAERSRYLIVLSVCLYPPLSSFLLNPLEPSPTLPCFCSV